ncbi:MAG: STAS domain-containing protein [bacterium]|nr:STAS domain-containing protein [bacterium]
MQVAWESVNGAWIVRLGGRLDVSKSEELEKILRQMLKQEPRPLVVNLEEVSYLSSSGIGVLLGIFRQLKGLELQMVLCQVSPAVEKLLEVVELSQVFRIFDRENDAIESIGSENPAG